MGIETKDLVIAIILIGLFIGNYLDKVPLEHLIAIVYATLYYYGIKIAYKMGRGKR